ncbi:MAG: methyltransferase domain-containing protein [Bacteroidota bacterium]
MSSENFSTIAQRYRETSIIQKSAAETLFSLLDLKDGESVLDIGCGTGNLTKKIFDITHGRTVGIDPSKGMIDESIKSYGNIMEFRMMRAEDLDFKNEFDAVFCNSTFQWIRDVDKVTANFYRALKNKGRVGIQAPGRRQYCPNFIAAVSEVLKNPGTREYFRNFKHPWFFRDSADEYSQYFIRQGFHIALSEIQTMETYHSPEETYEIFASGAIAGYLNKEYYPDGFDESYKKEFERIVKDSFYKQAGSDGKVKLVFNRIFLIAEKSA